MKKTIKWMNIKFSGGILILFYLLAILPVWILLKIYDCIKRNNSGVSWEKVKYPNNQDFYKSAY
ncbi:hypothetical protein A2159_02395 [Candidatus Woesebacteria bacterium RBG_13_34_9]|uniref:Uncharacterized protein n=1 Tax=Candidatus Woesebacteria bacterium RBG_13_34_9 TaxID=1802477 RepID=A0A1F7X3G0_9BACT|nr:MAG: hypothetical protein A2159_02395 [Candidatus Woesebacteria bacterium RBG_13_34_9]